MFSQSVVTIYSVKLIFLWDFPLKISFLRCFLKSIRYFRDPHRCCLDSFFYFCFLFFSELYATYCLYHSFQNHFHAADQPHRERWCDEYKSYAYVLCVNSINVFFHSTNVATDEAFHVSQWVCVHVCVCAFWCIENGITHKSRENKENDIFICYRL